MHCSALDIKFGDWFLGGVGQMKVLGNDDSLQLNESIEQCQTFLAETKFGLQDDFFKKIKQQNQGLSSELIIVNVAKDLLGLIIEQISNERISSFSTVQVKSNRQAFKTCLEHLSTHEFLWLQFDLSSNYDE